jgi:hypothetical protein
VSRARLCAATAAVLGAAADFMSGCSSERTAPQAEPTGAELERVPLGGGEQLVLREGRRGDEPKSWRDEVVLERAGAAVWRSRVALLARAFDHLVEADADSVVVAGQPPGSAYFSLQVLGRGDGVLRWSTAPRDQPPLWRLDRGDLFELTETHLHRYDARSGERRWSWKHDLDRSTLTELRPTDTELVLVGRDGTETRVARGTGERQGPAPGGGSGIDPTPR